MTQEGNPHAPQNLWGLGVKIKSHSVVIFQLTHRMRKIYWSLANINIGLNRLNQQQLMVTLYHDYC